MCFFVLSWAWDEEKILSSLWNRTSDLQIPLSDALPLTPPLSDGDFTRRKSMYDMRPACSWAHIAELTE